jgi:hypothetical protein
MYLGNSSFGNTARSLAYGGLGLLLLLGGAGCLGADGTVEGDEDVTEVTSAITLTGPTGHTYVFSSNAVTFNAAKTACQSQGLHLVSIHDASENDWVFQQEQKQGGGNWWVGYTDQTTEGLWAWTDGTGQGFVNWNVGEPNSAGDEDCVNHYTGTGGKWNDINCGNSYRFICESGGTETPLAPFWLQISNTNSDTQNYVQFAIDETAGRLLTIGTCGSDTGDTYLRLMNPNNTQLAENDDACGPNGRQSQLSVAVPTTGTYVLRGGCYSNTACGGIVSVTK